ncbi:MAG: DUF1573 domain-containing protein [Muribaculaceae bacterium]|nr:DUF1573 domain-containing protein [Muribaculaceae bacterium]
MKNARLLLCAAMALCALSAMSSAGARWLETKHNFGAFAEETGPVTCEFLMVNDGPGDASIIAARATCGCTQPTYTVNSIAPGDTARLSVTFDPMGRPGRFTKQIYVETSGTPAKQRLDITGVVIGAGETVARRFPVDMGPLKLATGGIMIGDVTKGHLKTVYTEGYNRSADSLRVAVVRKPSWIEVIPSPEVAAPGEQVTLISYLNSTACPQYGLIEDSVTISPVPGLEFTLPLTVMVNEDFSQLGADGMEKAPIAVINEQYLDYGTINRADSLASRSFNIGNTGRSKLLIRRIYTTDPGIDIKFKNDTVGRGKKVTVTVTVDPTAITGDILNAKLVIITNDPLQPVRTLRLVGSLR